MCKKYASALLFSLKKSRAKTSKICLLFSASFLGTLVYARAVKWALIHLSHSNLHDNGMHPT